METKRVSAKQLIKDAFVRLLHRKEYQDITVTDIVRCAGVARVTYYRVFGSIDSVFNSVVDDFYEYCRKEIVLPILYGNQEAMQQALMCLFLRLTELKESLAVFKFINFTLIISRMMDRLTAELQGQECGIDKRYGPMYKSCLLLSIAMQWVNLGFEESAEEMTQYVVDIFTKLQ